MRRLIVLLIMLVIPTMALSETTKVEPKKTVKKLLALGAYCAPSFGESDYRALGWLPILTSQTKEMTIIQFATPKKQMVLAFKKFDTPEVCMVVLPNVNILAPPPGVEIPKPAEEPTDPGY